MLSEEAMSCKYKFEVAVVLVAEILIANGPPVTVNVYQPSLLKVPMGQDVEVGVVAIFGASCALLFIAAVPPGSQPLIVITSAAEQFIP